MSERYVAARTCVRQVGAAVLALSVAGGAARACMLPVWRYARANWPADSYEALVFHRGALGAEVEDSLRALCGGGSGATVNVEVLTVDLASSRMGPRGPADEAWSGPDSLRVRVDTVQRLASLPVLVCPAKREVYRIQQAQFEAMTAQFRSQDVRG